MNKRSVRLYFGAVFLIALVGVTLNVWAAVERSSADYVAGAFFTPLSRALNQFAYFSIQSNLLVGGFALYLAIRPRLRSEMVHAWWVAAIAGIITSSVVYQTILASQYDLSPKGAVASQILHGVVPILAVGGLLIFRAHNGISYRVVGLSLVFPICWLIFTLIRGSVIGWYPYSFLDAPEIGAGRVAIHCFGLAVLLGLLGLGIQAIDRRLHAQAQRSNSPNI